MSKLAWTWQARQEEPIWYNHYATIKLIVGGSVVQSDVYELQTVTFDPINKLKYNNKQVFVGAFNTLVEAQNIAKMKYDYETAVRETAVY
jgi:hypothetical protein